MPPSPILKSRDSCAASTSITWIAVLLALTVTALHFTGSPSLAEAVRTPSARARAARRNSFAESTKAEWIPGEHVRVVLQQDLNATFFFVEDDAGEGIDPIRSFLMSAEGTIRELFHHLLFRPGCSDREQREHWGAACVSSTVDARKQVVLDVGANRGYYSLLAASYGHLVYSFDPQPHCASLLKATVVFNGYEDRIFFHHRYVSDQPDKAIQVRKRTGCTGTFPNDNHDGWADSFRKPLETYDTANNVVQVSGVALDNLFDPKLHDVLLLKMDIEGHETHALASAKKLLEGNAVRNIVVEFNLPMLGRQADGIVKMKTQTVELIKWLMNDLGYACKGSHKGHWKVQEEMALREWEELFALERDMFVTIDAWFFKK